MKRKFEYIIKVDGKDVWRGSDPTEKLFDEIRKKNPGKEVGIEIYPGDEILVA